MSIFNESALCQGEPKITTGTGFAEKDTDKAVKKKGEEIIRKVIERDIKFTVLN